MTTPQIREQHPGWYLWRDGVIPGDAAHPGETVEQVGARADAVLARVRPLLAEGDVVLVSHGHFLRVLAARWLGLEPRGPPAAAGHGDAVHPGHRARPAGRADVERAASLMTRPGQCGLTSRQVSPGGPRNSCFMTR